jgi:hypothetical protein
MTQQAVVIGGEQVRVWRTVPLHVTLTLQRPEYHWAHGPTDQERLTWD